MRKQLLYPILSLIGLLIFSPLLVFAHMGGGELYILFFYGYLIGYLIWRIPKTIALWKAFKKAGEAEWKAVVPFYDGYVMFKIAGIKNGFRYMIVSYMLFGVLIILPVLPDTKILDIFIADIIVSITVIFSLMVLMVMHFMFARKYGWGVFASILFAIFYPVGILVLGFGNSKYEGESQETVVDA